MLKSSRSLCTITTPFWINLIEFSSDVPPSPPSPPSSVFTRYMRIHFFLVKLIFGFHRFLHPSRFVGNIFSIGTRSRSVRITNNCIHSAFSSILRFLYFGCSFRWFRRTFVFIAYIIFCHSRFSATIDVQERKNIYNFVILVFDHRPRIWTFVPPPWLNYILCFTCYYLLDASLIIYI